MINREKIKSNIEAILEKHLDVIIDKDENTYDVEIYSYLNWGSIIKEEYEKQENILDSLFVETKKYAMYASYDVSGFEYWMLKQEEPNYLNIVLSISEDINDDEFNQLLEHLKECLNIIDNNITETEF